jgi:hypothetical protein
MIAAITISHLCERPRNEDIGVTYVFGNYKAQLRQNSTSLLATVLKQLVRSRPDVAGPVISMYENPPGALQPTFA